MDVDGAEAEASDGQGIGEGGGDAAEDQWDIDELDASDAEDTEGEGDATKAKEGGAELSRQRPAESEAPQDHGRSSSGSGVQLVAVCGICKKSSKDGRLPTPWEMLEEEGVRRGIRDRGIASLLPSFPFFFLPPWNEGAGRDRMGRDGKGVGGGVGW